MKLFVFPGNLDPEILKLGGQEVPYARTPSFGALVTHCHHRLASFAGSRAAQVLSFTASGTGAVEALLGGWGPAWRRLLVLHAGLFGRRWLKMAGHFGIPADSLAWPEHQEPPWEAIEAALASGAHDAAMVVHHETTTGELLDLARLGQLCQSAKVRLLVDAIGSFLADPFSMDEWNVDAAVISSQKGLCLPPGLSFLILRPSLGPPAEHPLGYYFHPLEHLNSFARGQPPWSPAAQIYHQLDWRLDQVGNTGGPAAECATVRAKAAAFRTALAGHGWEHSARHPSNCLTPIRFDRSATRLVHSLADEGWFVLPSADEALVRVAHLGMASADDHRELADRIIHHSNCLSLVVAPRTSSSPALA